MQTLEVRFPDQIKRELQPNIDYGARFRELADKNAELVLILKVLKSSPLIKSDPTYGDRVFRIEENAFEVNNYCYMFEEGIIPQELRSSHSQYEDAARQYNSAIEFITPLLQTADYRRMHNKIYEDISSDCEAIINSLDDLLKSRLYEDGEERRNMMGQAVIGFSDRVDSLNELATEIYHLKRMLETGIYDVPKELACSGYHGAAEVCQVKINDALNEIELLRELLK